MATGWGKGELNAYARSCHAYKSTVHSSCNLPSLAATLFSHIGVPVWSTTAVLTKGWT